MLFEFRIISVDAHPDQKDNSGNEYRDQEQCIKCKIAKIKVVVCGNKVKFNTKDKELKNKYNTNEGGTAFVGKGATASYLYRIFILQISGLFLLFFVAHHHHFLHIIGHVLK